MAAEYWVVGTSLLIQHWDGSTWVTQTAPVEWSSGTIWDIWGTDNKNLWAVGNEGDNLKGMYTTNGGTTWLDWTMRTTANAAKADHSVTISGAGANHILVCRTDKTGVGRIDKWDGSSWSIFSFGDTIWNNVLSIDSTHTYTSGRLLYLCWIPGGSYNGTGTIVDMDWSPDPSVLVARSTTDVVIVHLEDDEGPVFIEAARGEHGSWTNSIPANTGYTTPIAYPVSCQAVSMAPSGDVFITADLAGTTQIVKFSKSNTFSYTPLGAWYVTNAFNSAIHMASETSGVVVYRKLSPSNLTSYFYNGSSWVAEDTMQTSTSHPKSVFSPSCVQPTVCDYPLIKEKDHEFGHYKCLPSQHKGSLGCKIYTVPFVYGSPGVKIRKT